MFNISRTIIAALCMLTATPSFAALVETDWLVAGDKKATLDTVSGMEWLDLTYTIGLSVSNVQQKINNGEFAGWRIATATEVTNLYKNIFDGINFTGSFSTIYHNTHVSEALRIADTFGRTTDWHRNVSYGYMYSDNKTAAGFQGVYTDDPYDNRIYNYAYSTYSLLDAYHQAGVFMVSDGGVTLTSKNNPEINANNPNAPVNQVPPTSSDVSAPIGGASALLALMVAGLRRKKTAR